MRRGALVLLTGLGAALSSACSPLTLYNTLAPKDPARHPGRDIAYGAGPRRKLDVYIPRQGADRPRPVIVFFYGGGWNSGSRKDYAWVGHALAAQGYVVVIPDYRLVPEAAYPGFVQDGAQAVRWVRGHVMAYGGDPGRVVLAGHSAGAYIAMQLAMDDSFLRQAGVDPASIKAVAGLSGPYDFLPFQSPLSRNAFAAWPHPTETQPIAHVGPGRPPVFIAHGGKDDMVAVSNTINMARALKAAGNRVEAKVYPRLDHPGTILALSPLFRGKTPVMADMTAFLHKVGV